MSKKSKKRKQDRERKRTSARHRAETHKSGFVSTSLNLPKGVNLFAPKKAGAYRIEILDYEVPKGAGNPFCEDGERHYERTFWVHRGVGPDNSSYVCPKKTAKKKCPICEIRTKMTTDPDANEDLIKEMAPKERQIFNVFDYAEPDRGVQVWDISFYLFGEQLDAEVKNADEEDDYEYFADREDGMTLKIGMKEKSFAGNTFRQVESINFKARREALDPELFEAANVLDDLLIIEPYDKLKAIFLQTEEQDEEQEDQPERSSKKKKGKPEQNEEGELATWDDDDDDDDDKEPEHFVADDFGLIKGDTVVHEDHGVCTIAKISGDGTSLTLMDEDEEMHGSIAPDEVKKKKSKKAKKEKPKLKKEEPKEEKEWDENDDDFEDDDDDSWEED